MLSSGDVVDLDLGVRSDREAGFQHPAIVVTAQAVLDESPNVVQVVPVTKTLRGFGSEVVIAADDHNGLTLDSAAQCQHVRSVSAERVESVRGNVGSAVLTEIRRVLGILIDVT